jgi:hypothetical protein
MSGDGYLAIYTLAVFVVRSGRGYVVHTGPDFSVLSRPCLVMSLLLVLSFPSEGNPTDERLVDLT